ncbi:uncharacterized protein [Musca autumnalis]|uniref:uncharacterized protein n=1 Tax=Musca autumnalis TaxID=221902 RepID=UPI003CFA3AFA
MDHKGGSKKNGGVKQSNQDSIDKDVNRIMTPFTYSSVAKKPKKTYVHKPGAQMSKRMFEEPLPSSPVYMRSDLRVSELEKITVELLKFMQDFFQATNNTTASTAMSHFHSRIQKCGVDIEGVDNPITSSYHHGQDQGISV